MLDAVLCFFGGFGYPRTLSSTRLVLIPKSDNPKSFNDFQPISFCNANKVISKLLANRLAQVLPNIISPEYSCFVRGREIANNLVLSQEMISELDHKNRGGNIALKLDMAKAYDRLDWQFLMWVLRRFGFCNEWMDLMFRSVCNC